jgi:hypothetical protein
MAGPSCQQNQVATGAMKLVRHVATGSQSSRLNLRAKIEMPVASCQARLSVIQCSNGYESLAYCYYEFEAPRPIIEVSLPMCHQRRLQMPERHSLSLVEPITLSELPLLQKWHPMTTTSARWRRRQSPQWRGSACGTPTMTMTMMTPLTHRRRSRQRRSWRRRRWRRRHRRRRGRRWRRRSPQRKHR